MKKFINTLLVMVLVAFGQLAIQAQNTGAIAGTVVDQNGAVVPNATVTVKGESGQEFTVTTSDNGTYRIPAVQNGLYTVTVTTTTGFKTFVATNVKVDIGLPTTVDAALEVGGKEQIVEVTSGGEVLQTETATVGTTVTGRQITETPIASRSALDLVLLLPGTNQVGRPRASSVMGLPKGSLSITLDGVDVQDNLLKSSDGFFTYVTPKIDAIEEVTISTANPGAESSGDGAVQIKFATKRGTNRYTGGLFEQARNTALNANYFYQNRDGVRDPNGKAIRQKIILNQYGAHLGGPLPFPHFGEGGPIFNSGKDKAFFFFNYEEYRLPESNARTRVVLSQLARTGVYQYGTAAPVNVFAIAAANGQLATADPTVGAVFTRIAAATATTGTLTPITNSPNIQFYNFTPAGGQVRKFLAARFDFNLTKSNSLEYVYNRQVFDPAKDFLNGVDERFPGFPAYGQGSTRYSNSLALRSTLTKNIINEARFTHSWGYTSFNQGISLTDFDYQGGYNLGIAGISFGGTAITSPTNTNNSQGRTTPTTEFTDTITWILGEHNLSFGGNYKHVHTTSDLQNPFAPTVTFGIDTSEGILSTMFNGTTLPGSTTAQQGEARQLYATLIGHITATGFNAVLGTDGVYKVNGPQRQLLDQNTYGGFVQDNWRARPGLSITAGIRWQPQTAFIVGGDNYSRLADFNDIYGVSGAGNLFKPGTLTGRVPTVVGVKKGDKSSNDDLNNFAPSVGVVWSPGFSEKSILRSVFGESGRSVFRGGYSISFVREGTNLLLSILGSNPGGTLAASRSLSLGNLVAGTNLRDPGNPNLSAAPFPATPSYPRTLQVTDSANTFDPNIKSGSVHSFSFGYQREIDKNTVVEFRYAGNRGVGLQRQININEFNTIENGFAAEFALAQQNLYANIAAGRCITAGQTPITNPGCQNNFAYFGAGTGTSPLPIMISYFNAAAANLPNNPAGVAGTPYTTANFANTTLVANLSRNAPSAIAFGSGTSFENNATRRANAIANGRPSNFFYVNPTVAAGGAFLVNNDAKTWYDSGVVEVRRRLSAGLRLQANYVWSKAQTNSFQSSAVIASNYSLRAGGIERAKTVQPFDIRHAFKMDASYDLPFGKGATFFSDSGKLLNTFIGGFSIYPAMRWQSGSPIQIGNVALVGMTVKDLQKAVKVRKDAVVNGVNVVAWLPDDIILNSQRAFNISVSSSTGYGNTFDPTVSAAVGAPPVGRFLAPAGYGNCIQASSGTCGFNNLVIYGPSFFKFDLTVAKKFIIDERRNFELRATMLDALNHPNFRVGGWASDINTSGCCGSTFGQLGAGSAYQDTSTTNDPGGRLIDIVLRFNF